MDAWKNAFFLKKNHVHKIPRFRGGVFWVLGGECRFFFYGRADFLTKASAFTQTFLRSSRELFAASSDSQERNRNCSEKTCSDERFEGPTLGLHGQNRQSLAFCERSQISHAILQFRVE